MSNDIEAQIMNAAKELFFSQGKIKATSQEIADYAHVPRTSINYYFRSVKHLYNKVKEEALQQSKDANDDILCSALPFKEKVAQLIDSFMERLLKYPYLEGVIMSSENLQNAIEEGKVTSPPINSFLSEIAHEMKKGTIPTYDPRLFLIHLFSLMVYPALAKNLNMFLMNIKDKDYKMLMRQRKSLILNMLFPSQF